uniref:Ig-like domain-containing protein n=1 Tax=Panagrolaimus sp. PS1159 TaxID=55785 RepID=A0AC35FGA0_9BILA
MAMYRKNYFDIRIAIKRRKQLLSLNVLFVFTIFLAFFNSFTATNAQSLITGRPPSFTEFDKQNLIVPEGGSIDLKCPLIFDGFDIEWFKNSETLKKTGEKLNLPIVSRSDEGEYQCFASNGIGGAFSPVVNVTVLC